MKSFTCLIIVVNLLFTRLAFGGVFDSLKDPATLIQKKKDCVYGNFYPGEMLNGQLIYNQRILATFKK